MTRTRDLARRALLWTPGPDVPRHELVLFALGAGTAVTVVVSSAEQLIRLALQQRPPQLAGEPLAAAVGVLVVVLARGIDAAALWVLAVRAVSTWGTFLAAVLTYAYIGRVGVGDPLAQAIPTTFAVLAGAGIGLVTGTVARGLLPGSGGAPRAHVLLRAVGVAIVAGAIAHLVWPTTFLIAVSGATTPDDGRSILLQLPDLLVGPVAGGTYAARRGASYAALLAVGGSLALPAFLAELTIARALALIPGDPVLRGSLTFGLLLLALRVAAWPLAAAFARGFLTPPEAARTVSEDA